jgi:hypothetical protein
MATVSLIDPYSQQAEEIARRQRMAQALQESGSQVLQMPTTPGVAISPYAGLAKILESGLGAYKEKQAREDYAKLQTDYRDKYNTQFENFARALSAPAQEAFAGQEAIEAKPAQMAPQIEKSFGGYGMPREVGQYEVSPAVAGQAAIPARPALPAGYIGPETLKGFDIPEVKQLAMAKYLAQFEPKQVKLGQNERLLEQTGSGPFRELAGAAPAKADKLAPHWEATTQEVGGKPVAGWINLNAADKAASFVAGAKPTEAKAVAPVWKEVARGGKIYYENFNETDPAKRQAGAIEKETVKTPPYYSEIEKDGNVVIVDMSQPADQRLANAQIKGPIRNNLEKITTTDANGREVTRYVDKGLLATMGDIPAPYKGFMSDLADAGQLPPNWQSIPQIAGLVRENLINKAGGITPARLADIRVRIAEAAARLGDLGIAFDAKGLTPPLSNLTTLPSGSSAAAAPAAAIAKAPPKINDVVINGDKKFRFKGGDPNQQSNWVEVK